MALLLALLLPSTFAAATVAYIHIQTIVVDPPHPSTITIRSRDVYSCELCNNFRLLLRCVQLLYIYIDADDSLVLFFPFGHYSI